MKDIFRGLEELDGSRIKRDETSRKWLPGAKNKGEGILLIFNKERLMEWESEKVWVDLCQRMNEQGLNIISILEGFDFTPRGLLLHTFSHMLAKRISTECGYSLASLRERLYVSEEKNMYGIMLFTSSPDCEGSLGGIVSQAENLDKLIEHIYMTIEKANHCAQDPLCGLLTPEKAQRPWGASCHACTHLPETSCEGLMNTYLDRHTISGNGVEKKGYFENW